MSLVFFKTAPTPQQFRDFRSQCGWGNIDLNTAAKALQNSLIVISAHNDDELIGFVRAVGDASLNIYIQDLIVQEDHRGQKIGQRLMQNILAELSAVYPQADIGLMSAQGKEAFYTQFGFEIRPSKEYGAGMMKYVKPND